MNILQKWRDRRAQKRKLRELTTVSSTFATLDRLMASGLLSWQPKTRQMLIAEPLATIFMQTAEKWQAFIQNLYRWTYYQQCQEAWEKFFEREELKAVRDVLKNEELRMKNEESPTGQKAAHNAATQEAAPPSADGTAEAARPAGTLSQSVAAERNSCVPSVASDQRSSASLFTLHSSLSREDIDRIRRARRAEIAQSDMPAPKVQPFEFFCVRDTKDVQAQVVFVGHFDPDTDQIDMATWEDVQRLMQSAK